MDDVPCLKFTSTLVCVQVLLDLTDETNKKQAWRMLQYLKTGYFSAVSEDILKRLVDHYPHKLTNELLIAIAPPQIKELKLQNCTKITPSRSYRVFQKCRNVEKVNLNHCSQMMLPDLFVLLDLQKVNITSLSLEGCPTVNSEVVQSVLRNLKKLKHLNISSCRNVHNDSFLLSPEKQSNRHDVKDRPERDVYECSLVSIDISGCRLITDVGIQNLATLTGPTLRSVNAAWTEISPLSLLCLCGCLLPLEILQTDVIVEDEVRKSAVMRLVTSVQKYLQQHNSDELTPVSDTSQILACNTTSTDELIPVSDTSQILACNTTSTDKLTSVSDTSQILACNTTSMDKLTPVSDTSQILACNTTSMDKLTSVSDTSQILACNTTSMDELTPVSETSQILACNTTSTDKLTPVSDTSQILACNTTSTDKLTCNTTSTDEMIPVSDTSQILACNTTSTDEQTPVSDTSQILACNTTSTNERTPVSDTSQILACNTTSTDELIPVSDTSQILACNTTSMDELIPVSDTSQILACNTTSTDERTLVSDTSPILGCDTTSMDKLTPVIDTSHILACNITSTNLDEVDDSLNLYDEGSQEVNVDGCKNRSKMSASSEVTIDSDSSLIFVNQEAYHSPVSSSTRISETSGSFMDLGGSIIEISNTDPHKSLKSSADLCNAKIQSDKSEDSNLLSCDANDLPTGIPYKVPKNSVNSESESRTRQFSCVDSYTESVVQNIAQSCPSSSIEQCVQSLDISLDTECHQCHQYIFSNKDAVSHTILSENEMTSDPNKLLNSTENVPNIDKESGINLISGNNLDPLVDYSCSVIQDKSIPDYDKSFKCCSQAESLPKILEETPGSKGESLNEDVSQDVGINDKHKRCSPAHIVLCNHDDSTGKCSNKNTIVWSFSQKDNTPCSVHIKNDKTSGVLESEELSCPQHVEHIKPEDFQEATGSESVASADDYFLRETQLSNLPTEILQNHDRNKTGAKFSDNSQQINKDTDIAVVIRSASDSEEFPVDTEMPSTDYQQDQIISDQILTKADCNYVETSRDEFSVTAELSGEIIHAYHSNLMSLDISDIKLLEEDITRICLQYFIHKNSEIQKLGISWCNFKDEDLKNIAVKLKKLREITLIDCYALTSHGISFLGKNSNNLVKTDLKGVSFIGDRAIFPFLQRGNIESLGLAECNICDGTLINIAARNVTVMKKLDLSWCEEITERGINSLCSNKSDMESLSVRQCPASNLTLALMSTNFRNLKHINLSSIERVSDDAIVGMAKGLKHLEEIDIGWNSGLSNESVLGLLTFCPLLTKLVLSGLKLLTSAPFLPIISDLKQWRQCQACLQLKMKERELVDTEETENGSSDEEYDFLYVPHRSTIYAANLTSLHLEYCDSINDHHMREIVAVCRGSLQIVDYYSEDVQPVLLRPKKGKFNLALDQADLN